MSKGNREHVCLVTGAGRGIGEAIALELGGRGVAVACASRTLDECAAVAARIEEAGGVAWPVELDVTNTDSIADAVAALRERATSARPIDWLVNNAGMAISAPILQEGNLYERHLDVNFHGPRHMIEALVPDMIERGYGRVVNIASSAALVGYAYVAAYVSSKHAILGYTKSAAIELEKTGVTFNSVCPHYVDSPMTVESVRRIAEKTGRTEEAARSFFEKQNPGGRLVRPEEVAHATLQLCEGDANGTLIELDGSEA